MEGTKIEIGQEIHMNRRAYSVVKVGDWEVVLEAKDGSRKYPRRKTVDALRMKRAKRSKVSA